MEGDVDASTDAQEVACTVVAPQVGEQRLDCLAPDKLAVQAADLREQAHPSQLLLCWARHAVTARVLDTLWRVGGWELRRELFVLLDAVD